MKINELRTATVISLLEHARQLRDQAEDLLDMAQDLCTHKNPDGTRAIPDDSDYLVHEVECTICGLSAFYLYGKE